MSDVRLLVSTTSKESTIRLNPACRKQLDSLRKKFGMTRAGMLEVSLSAFEHVLQADVEITLPELTHEVINLEHQVGRLVLQLEQLETLTQLILAHEYESADIAGNIS